MKCHETKLRVRYGETDQMGVVHHGEYVKYLEMGRIEWLRDLGISYKKMEEDGIILPVVSLSIKYKKSAGYDDLIYVKTELRKWTGATIEFDYELLDENRQILSIAHVVLACLDKSTNKPKRLPEFLIEKISA